MTEFLREWTMSLAGIIVFGSLCEMLLPGSVYKKYINLAVGLILCVALISPFIKDRPKLSFDIPSVDVALNEAEESEDVLTVYSKKLCENIEEELKKVTDLEIDVKCQVSDNAESYGEIENIYLLVDAKDERKLDSSITDKISNMYGAKNIDVKYIK